MPKDRRGRHVGSERRPPLCRYFNSQGGCRDLSSCRFLHVRVNNETTVRRSHDSYNDPEDASQDFNIRSKFRSESPEGDNQSEPRSPVGQSYLSQRAERECFTEKQEGRMSLEHEAHGKHSHSNSEINDMKDQIYKTEKENAYLSRKKSEHIERLREMRQKNDSLTTQLDQEVSQKKQAESERDNINEDIILLRKNHESLQKDYLRNQQELNDSKEAYVLCKLNVDKLLAENEALRLQSDKGTNKLKLSQNKYNTIISKMAMEKVDRIKVAKKEIEHLKNIIEEKKKTEEDLVQKTKFLQEENDKYKKEAMEEKENKTFEKHKTDEKLRLLVLNAETEQKEREQCEREVQILEHENKKLKHYEHYEHIMDLDAEIQDRAEMYEKNVTKLEAELGGLKEKMKMLQPTSKKKRKTDK